MTKRTGKIYKIVNDINSKIYVGQTIQSLKTRFQKHCNIHDEPHMVIAKAINKYGKEHFKIELIEKIPNCTQEQLNNREIYWIAFYDSYKNGYNSTKGGQNIGTWQKLSEEEEQELVKLYEQGISSLKLAKKFNVDKTTILNYAKRYGLKRKDILESKYDLEAIKSYIRENKPLAEDVVKKFGLCKCSVYNLIKRSNDDTLILESYHPRRSNAVICAKEVCDKYNEGYNIQDLIKMFHSSKRYISKVLKENGIKIERNRKALLVA